ncbi:MAG: hypothetical protein MJ211_13120 [Bacteroidales bacterium]|nr:hypothetical protein [Bacteroidales bacterium]
MKKIIILLITICSLSSCRFYMDEDFDDLDFKFENNSETDIQLLLLENNSDTVLPNLLSNLLITYSVSANSCKDIVIGNCDYKSLSIFILNKNVFNNNSWNNIKDNYLIEQRYFLSKKDLETLNFEIPYPPSSNMENMNIIKWK